ncbi:ABC transporter ATP-binding protein [soil metagenome]
MAVIEVDGLVKTYGTTTAVDGMTFRVEAGEVYGLLGENGAGKSTTIEILEGHRRRTHGSVTVLGHDPAHGDRDLQDRIGIMLQKSGIGQQLTVTEEVTAYAVAYRRRRDPGEAVEMVGLTASRDQRVSALSGGQQRRLDLALGIVGRPDLLFLDEPTTGFDPSARRGAWELIRALGADGTTVVLTSHYLDEVQHLADRVGVMMRGRMIAEGTTDELISGLGATVVRFVLPDGVTAADVAGVVSHEVSDVAGVAELTTEAPTRLLHTVTGWAVERGVELSGLTVERPSLEDLFLELTAVDRGRVHDGAPS